MTSKIGLVVEGPSLPKQGRSKKKLPHPSPIPRGERELTRLPMAAPRMRIGLLGGSFNPPHDAHLKISLTALKRLKLDRVWWLVSPGNPLKDPAKLPSLADRVAAARDLARHPR